MNSEIAFIEDFCHKTWECPIKIIVHPQWGAEHPHHRADIHAAKEEYKDDSESYSSISHTRGLGGFAIAPRPMGFDLESQNRTVSEKVFKRFTIPNERSLGFEPLEAWVAKEAAFKATWNAWDGNGQNVSVLTEICLVERQFYSHLNGCTFSFKRRDSADMAPLGRGLVAPAGRFLLGIAVIFT